jgi:branched-subunit amino acid aminotransferase/4-amino-4-deoxychorismate lyase
MPRVLVDGLEGGGIPGDDPGLVRGMTVFETLRTYGRTPFRLGPHLARLEASALEMGVPMPPVDVVESEIKQVLDAEDQWVRILLTLGGHRVVSSGPVELARVGRPVPISFIQWEPSPWLPGSIKHTSRAGWERAAEARGVQEVVFVDGAGLLLEAGRSNLFGVVDGEVFTPPADGRILVGVTRTAMLEAADRAGLSMRVESMQAVAEWDELYLSSTIKELAPCSLDGRVKSGPVGRRLHEAFQELVRVECLA